MTKNIHNIYFFFLTFSDILRCFFEKNEIIFFILYLQYNKMFCKVLLTHYIVSNFLNNLFSQKLSYVWSKKKFFFLFSIINLLPNMALSFVQKINWLKRLLTVCLYSTSYTMGQKERKNDPPLLNNSHNLYTTTGHQQRGRIYYKLGHLFFPTTWMAIHIF